MKIASVLVVAVLAMVGLTGCPSNSLVQRLNTQDEATGYPVSITLPTIGAGVAAPDGNISMSYKGGGGFKSVTVELKLAGIPEMRPPLNLYPASGGKAAYDEKCVTCSGAYVITGAVILGGAAIGATSHRDTGFDINLTLGPEVELALLVVKGNDQNAIATATIYGPAYFDGTVDPEDGYRLAKFVNPANAGTIRVNPDKNFYSPGEEVIVEFIPNAGYRFVGWTVNGSAGIGDLIASIRMDSDVQLTARAEAIAQPGDTTPPVITLIGSNPMSLTVGTPYVDPGATAIDAVSGPAVVVISGTVNTAIAGTYTVTYSATDPSGNTATATRTVVVRNVDVPEPGTTPKMVYTLLSNGSLQQKFEQDGCTLQQCWLGFPAGKSWSDVDVMGTMFMVGNNPLLFVETATNNSTTVTLSNSAFAPGLTARAVPYIKMKGNATRLYGNTGIVAGYLGSTKLTRSDGDNYDLAL